MGDLAYSFQTLPPTPLFSNDARGVLLRAKVRSLQSTPLIDQLRRFVGLVSTHYSRPAGTTLDVFRHVDSQPNALAHAGETQAVTLQRCIGIEVSA